MVKFFKGLPVNAVATPGSIDRSRDQSCRFQFFQVLRNGRLGQWEHFDDFAANAFISLGQHFQDSDPGGMAHGFGKAREILFLLDKFIFFVKGHFNLISQIYDKIKTLSKYFLSGKNKSSPGSRSPFYQGDHHPAENNAQDSGQ